VLQISSKSDDVFQKNIAVYCYSCLPEKFVRNEAIWIDFLDGFAGILLIACGKEDYFVKFGHLV
jgi:hypothetical protein